MGIVNIKGHCQTDHVSLYYY